MGRWVNRDPIGEPGALLIRQVAATGFFQLHPAGVSGVVRESSFRKFIPRNGEDRGGVNRYAFVVNQPVSLYDAFGEECGGDIQDGLKKCGSDRLECDFRCELGNRFIWNYWARKKCLQDCDNVHYNCTRDAFPNQIKPLPSNSPECDKYCCDDEYFNTRARCFCKCAGDGPWSNHVRGCLRQMYEANVCPNEAHVACYLLGDRESGGDMPSAKLLWCFTKCFDYNPFD